MFILHDPAVEDKILCEKNCEMRSAYIEDIIIYHYRFSATETSDNILAVPEIVFFKFGIWV